MAISKAMRTALRALSYANPDVKDSYPLVRAVEKASSRHVSEPADCDIRTILVPRSRFSIFDIPVRVFTPMTRASKGVILFFHGGGWVSGDIDSYSAVCIRTAKILSRTVVSVDYHRAPEFKFPFAPEDCYEVARQLYAGNLLPGVDPDDIVLFGDSAGGNLAAAVSLMARDRGEFGIRRQILIYPATGNDHSKDSQYESVRTNGTGYLLTSQQVEEYMDMYISKEEDRDDPYLAPLLAEDLSHQPETLVITAQYCPLRDEGEAYGRRLADAGNKVSIHRLADALHGYFLLPLRFKHVRVTYALIEQFLDDGKKEEGLRG